MDIRPAFVDETGRVRSGWRFAIFCVGFICVVVVLGGVAGALLGLLDSSVVAGGAGLVATALTALTGGLLVGWLCGKYLEGLPFRALGAWFTRHWLRNLIAGILFGAGTLALAVLIAFASGGLRFEFSNIDGAVLARSLAGSFLIFALGAAWEEALFRGYILQTFARSGLAALAIGLTAVFFGAIHAGNPSADVISILNTMLAGVWLGIAYLKTRDLWFVWGMHLMWNWMQGAFFGIEVSGLTNLVSAPLLKEIDTGPAWLTGETYGVEGGVVTTIAMIVSMIVIYYLPGLKPSEEAVWLTTGQHRES
ncbi:MAG: CPBP family intramembrane glutamic endopeptidase [Pyrinomonadaceae bacterium]